MFYTKLAKYYDRIYSYIDYKKQVEFFIRLIKGNKILDIACGTGTHADWLQKKRFEVVGVDISKDMLNEAKKKNSNVRFIQADMKEIDLGEKFGTIICFFNSILYNKNKEEMIRTLKKFHRHLQENGVLIFDAVDKSIGINSEKEEYKYEEGNLKIVFKPRWIYDNGLFLDIDFIINDEEFHDYHEMGGFSFNELKKLCEKAGFKVQILEKNFDEIKEYHSGDKTAIFVCKR